MKPSVSAWALAMLAACALQGPARAAGPIAPAATEAAGGHLHARPEPCEPALPGQPSGLLALHRTLHALRRRAPARPGRARRGERVATIDPSSIETDNPDPTYDFDAQLRARRGSMPRVPADDVPLDPGRADRAGHRAHHGRPHAARRDAPGDPGRDLQRRLCRPPARPFGARIGFSAQGSLERSRFGIAEGVPAPGPSLGVGDAVEILIEAEFTRPTPVGQG